MGWLEGALGFCSAGDKVAMRLQYPKNKEGSGRRILYPKSEDEKYILRIDGE